MKCKIPRPPGIPRLAPSGRPGRGKPGTMSVPPVDGGRRAPVPTASDAAPGRLACSLQSLRGRLSRGRAPEAAAPAAVPAAAPDSDGPTAAQNGTARAPGQSRRDAAVRAGSEPREESEERSDAREDSRETRAPGASGKRADGGEKGQESRERGQVTEADRAQRDGGLASEDTGVARGAPRPAPADLVHNQTTANQSTPTKHDPPRSSPTATSSGGDLAPSTAGSSGASEKPSTAGSSGASEKPSTAGSSGASEKPHVCGSFFSPCCAARRAGGVKTFSGAAAASGGAGAADSGAAASGSGAGRRRSPVSLARILARPVFSTSPPPPARKKSSVVYFHPEFQPGVIGEEEGVDSGGPRVQMPSRSMGNSNSAGAPSPQPRSPTFRPRVTLPPDYEYMKKLVPELKLEIKQKDGKIAQLEVELNEARRMISKRETEVSKLHREIHKIQSVLAQASPPLSNGDLAGKLHESHLTAHNKKQGVSGESSQLEGRNMTVTAPKFEKDFRSKQLIKEAIMDNDFLKKLDASQLREIVDSMYPKKYAKGTFIIREGEVGSHLFVAAEGQMEVIKDGQVLGQMGPGKAFGELAILYNCTRTASIKAVTDVHVWELERRVFQTVMMRTAIRRLEDNVSFLRSVPLLAKLSRDKLIKMADVIETETYAPGSYIIRQGTSGDGFYIISSGSVKVTQRSQDGVEDEIRTLKAGEYFGEQALLREDKRTANIIALPPSVTVLALDRTSFARLIGDLQELRDLKYEERPVSRTSSAHSARLTNEYSHLALDSLDIIATLGIGGFGRVELVQSSSEPGTTLALKCLKKHYIVETQQQEHVHSEKEIMLRCNHQFIVRLYKTFKDSKYVYLLMDACLGGEVWSILRDRGQFDSEACRFYTACVVEALEYLHTRHIVYRDLKPENLLLDTDGFCKLTDFGFSKELRNHGKTWTFCGTPEYVSPEVILNKGHDRAVDYWSLGVLMYELYTGAPPFTASDPMKTYNIILKGIDIIDFPRNIPRSGEQLIKRLCRDIPTERLGYQRNGVEDIRKHRWFQGFDWEGLRARQLTPPIMPQVKGPTDASNFDCYSRDLETPPDELSGWDEDF